MSALQVFLDKYKVIPKNREHDQVYFVMTYLQDEIAEKDKFNDFQEILDNIDPNDLISDDEDSTAVCTIALVAWWYGNKLKRDIYLGKALEFYTKLKGAEYAHKLLDRFGGKAWEPQFGFEKQLFGITKS